jgi:RNA polymerase sigma factor (sigma-70 family)
MTREEYSQAYVKGFESTMRLMLARGANSDHAREVTQAAWAKGWEYLHQLRNPAMVVPWINTIAMNMFRNLSRHAWLELPPEIPTGSPSGSSDLATMVVSRVLEVCNPKERQLFEQQMEGMTTHEMAAASGASETAIRIRLLRARRAVKERLERRAARSRRLCAEGAMVAHLRAAQNAGQRQ